MKKIIIAFFILGFALYAGAISQQYRGLTYSTQANQSLSGLIDSEGYIWLCIQNLADRSCWIYSNSTTHSLYLNNGTLNDTSATLAGATGKLTLSSTKNIVNESYCTISPPTAITANLQTTNIVNVDIVNPVNTGGNVNGLFFDDIVQQAACTESAIYVDGAVGTSWDWALWTLLGISVGAVDTEFLKVDHIESHTAGDKVSLNDQQGFEVDNGAATILDNGSFHYMRPVLPKLDCPFACDLLNIFDIEIVTDPANVAGTQIAAMNIEQITPTAADEFALKIGANWDIGIRLLSPFDLRSSYSYNDGANLPFLVQDVDGSRVGNATGVAGGNAVLVDQGVPDLAAATYDMVKISPGAIAAQTIGGQTLTFLNLPNTPATANLTQNGVYCGINFDHCLYMNSPSLFASSAEFTSYITNPNAASLLITDADGIRVGNVAGNANGRMALFDMIMPALNNQTFTGLQILPNSFGACTGACNYYGTYYPNTTITANLTQSAVFAGTNYNYGLYSLSPLYVNSTSAFYGTCDINGTYLYNGSGALTVTDNDGLRIGGATTPFDGSALLIDQTTAAPDGGDTLYGLRINESVTAGTAGADNYYYGIMLDGKNSANLNETAIYIGASWGNWGLWTNSLTYLGQNTTVETARYIDLQTAAYLTDTTASNPVEVNDADGFKVTAGTGNFTIGAEAYEVRRGAVSTNTTWIDQQPTISAITSAHTTYAYKLWPQLPAMTTGMAVVAYSLTPTTAASSTGGSLTTLNIGNITLNGLTTATAINIGSGYLYGLRLNSPYYNFSTSEFAGQLAVYGNANFYDTSYLFNSSATKGVIINDPQGIQLSGATALGTCDVSNRGRMIHMEAIAGTHDSLCVCSKQADNSYSWETIFGSCV